MRHKENVNNFVTDLFQFLEHPRYVHLQKKRHNTVQILKGTLPSQNELKGIETFKTSRFGSVKNNDTDGTNSKASVRKKTPELSCSGSVGTSANERRSVDRIWKERLSIETVSSGCTKPTFETT